jgi:hypothetical protein
MLLPCFPTHLSTLDWVVGRRHKSVLKRFVAHEGNGICQQESNTMIDENVLFSASAVHYPKTCILRLYEMLISQLKSNER